MNNKATTISLVALAALTPIAALKAEPYQFEVGANYITGDTDVDDIEINEDNFSIEGTYYFTPLESSGAVRAEVPFLRRASYVNLGVDIESLDNDISDAIDSETYRINGRFTNPDTGWYLGLGYVNADADFDDDVTQQVVGFTPEYDGYSLKIGRYILPNTTIDLGYSQLDYDGDLFVQSEMDSSSDALGVGFKHVGSITENVSYSLGANYYFLDLQFPEIDNLDDDFIDESGDVYSFSATIYPSDNLGFGISYTESDDLMGAPFLTSDNMIYDGLGLSADWFINDRVGLFALYNQEDYDIANADDIQDPGEVDGDTLLFGVKARF